MSSTERPTGKLKKENKTLKTKTCRVKFTPYQSNKGLQMMGGTTAILRAAGGATVNTISVHGERQHTVPAGAEG